MDFLSHILLPLTVAYVIVPEWFHRAAVFTTGGAGLIPDFDKFIGVPGLLHSLVPLLPLCIGLIAIERWYRGAHHYALLGTGMIGSHLVLDIIDGGPVPLLYPFVKVGIGLQYPAQIVFGTGFFGIYIEGALIALRLTTPRPGFNTYGFIQGNGVAWLLVFILFVVTLRHGGQSMNQDEGSSRPERGNDPTEVT